MSAQASILLEAALAENQLMPCRTLARKLVAEHPDQFADFEKTYAKIRRWRGVSGVHNRVNTASKRHYYPTGSAAHLRASGLPEAESWDASPVDLLGTEQWLVLSDLQIPFHEPAAIEQALKQGRRDGVDGILLDGDIADCYQLSDFCREPGRALFAQEVYGLAELLATLRNKFPKARIVWKSGNHDDRILTYMARRVPDLFPVVKDVFNWQTLLDFDELGVEYVEPYRFLRIGKLNVIHGHEMGKTFAAPVNPARGFYNQLKSIVLGAHHHQTSQHNEPDIRGELTTCWSIGCLCHLNPKWRPLNKWNLGFAKVRLTSDSGNFEVDNYRILRSGLMVK